MPDLAQYVRPAPLDAVFLVRAPPVGHDRSTPFGDYLPEDIAAPAGPYHEQRVSGLRIEEYPHPDELAVEGQRCLVHMQHAGKPYEIKDLPGRSVQIRACHAQNVVDCPVGHPCQVPPQALCAHPVWHALQKVLSDLEYHVHAIVAPLWKRRLRPGLLWGFRDDLAAVRVHIRAPPPPARFPQDRRCCSCMSLGHAVWSRPFAEAESP